MLRLVSAVTLAACLSMNAQAAGKGGVTQESWQELRTTLFQDREISDARGIVTLTAPKRADDDARVPISASVALPEGETIKRMIIMIDDNPMPVSADFAMDAPIETFSTDVTMRLNMSTYVRAIVETSDGRLLMDSKLVKTSGRGACAAPPVTDPAIAMATLGNMELTGVTPGQPRLSIKHPQNSGMQMNQITLLYILAHYVDQVESWADDEKLFTMTGSISLSENPDIQFSVPESAGELRVRVTDTEELIFEKRFPLSGA